MPVRAKVIPTHTNHHHDMLSTTQVKHEGGRKQAKKHQTNNKKVLAKVYDECVVASNQVLLVPDLEEVEDGEYSSSDTDSDDDVVEVQVPASCPVHDEVLEEHAKAVQEVQAKH